MKRTILPVLITLSLGVSSLMNAQNLQKCGSNLNYLETLYPGIKASAAEFYENLDEIIDNINLTDQPEAGPRIIPVVVHVIHAGGIENISDAQIQSGIDVLNQDYQLNNPDTVNIPLQFDTLKSDINIEFRLATIDPDGNCTDGIVRVFSGKTSEVADITGFKKLSYWDRSKYLNIWIVRTIKSTSPFGTTLGYAQFPFQIGPLLPKASTDGITVIHNAFGTIGTTTFPASRTSSHEVGHWLGLRHIWGDEECGNDGVDDTPPHFGPNMGCPTFPEEAICITPLTQADSIRRYAVGEMFNNYMDYTSGSCQNMFSKGQKGVMEGVFLNYAFRGSLIQTANSVATGTDDASFANPCTPAPIADMWSINGTQQILKFELICAGQNLQFYDGAYNGIATSRSWTFEGGTPATSTVVNPTVTYNNTGSFDVTYTVSNAQGSNTKTRADYIKVLSNTADISQYAFYENFEYASSAYQNGLWINVNQYNQANRWEQISGVGYSGVKSMVMLNEDNIRSETDALITPSIDLSANTGNDDVLSFWYAYGNKSSNFADNNKLEVFVSTNCGEFWIKQPISTKFAGTATDLSKASNNINTAGLFPDGFIPTSQNQWAQATVNLAIYSNFTNVRVMFYWTTGDGFGNNFYIDKIYIGSQSQIGIEPLGKNIGITIMPNPVNAISTINITAPKACNGQIQLYSITGKLIKTIYNGAFIKGVQSFTIARTDVGSAGLYFVKATLNGTTLHKKVIIQ